MICFKVQRYIMLSYLHGHSKNECWFITDLLCYIFQEALWGIKSLILGHFSRLSLPCRCILTLASFSKRCCISFASFFVVFLPQMDFPPSPNWEKWFAAWFNVCASPFSMSESPTKDGNSKNKEKENKENETKKITTQEIKHKKLLLLK